MGRFVAIALAAALSASPAAAGIMFNYEQIGSTIPSNCPPGFPAPPLCNVIDATGVANDVLNVIPGRMVGHASRPSFVFRRHRNVFI